MTLVVCDFRAAQWSVRTDVRRSVGGNGPPTIDDTARKLILAQSARFAVAIYGTLVVPSSDATRPELWIETQLRNLPTSAEAPEAAASLEQSLRSTIPPAFSSPGGLLVVGRSVMGPFAVDITVQSTSQTDLRLTVTSSRLDHTKAPFVRGVAHDWTALGAHVKLPSLSDEPLERDQQVDALFHSVSSVLSHAVSAHGHRAVVCATV